MMPGTHCLNCLPYHKWLSNQYLKKLFDKLEYWKDNDEVWRLMYDIFSLDLSVKLHFDNLSQFITTTMEIRVDGLTKQVTYLKIVKDREVHELSRFAL